MKKNKGITLIALIVTIIILLILAGITITFMLGDNGILNRAKNAGETYEEQAAREKLEIALADLGADKIVDSAYNENAYIDDKLAKQDMIVNGDIVIVDGWQFEIDRSVPKIAASIGRGEQNEQIQIRATSVISSDYTKATIQVEITYVGNITSITIKGENIAIPTPNNNVYTVDKEVTENGKYAILVKDENENYKTASITISDITEDMNIYTVKDLVAFKDRINIGATYEGRTVQVMNNLDLSSICGKNINGNKISWEPIGANGTAFAGTFNGNYHTISNLYIDSNKYIQMGFFRSIANNGIIENLVMENIYIYNNYNLTPEYSDTGGLVCFNSGIINNCGINSGIIQSYSDIIPSNNGWNAIFLGGISSGRRGGIISNSYNKATVNAIGLTSYGNFQTCVGGIQASAQGKTINCYNTGTISGTGSYVFAGGIAGEGLRSSFWICKKLL